MSELVVSAPGKMMLFGEYAVLRGAEAVVAAVDARVEARVIADACSLPPEVSATLAQAGAEVALSLDASALRAGDRKLGLGSSSAGAAAAAGVALALRGDDPAAHRDQAFAWAFDGHRAVAPRGSGADIAAAVHGGILRFRPTEGRPVLSPLALPEGVVPAIVWTGHPARTSDFLDAVSAFSERDAAACDACFARLAEASRDALSALDGTTEDLLRATAAYHDAMDALGQGAEIPIVEERLAQVASRAAAFGGAAKPSGAGGGDVAIAFFPDEEARFAFQSGCLDDGFGILRIGLGAEGVRREPVEPPR